MKPCVYKVAYFRHLTLQGYCGVCQGNVVCFAANVSGVYLIISSRTLWTATPDTQAQTRLSRSFLLGMQLLENLVSLWGFAKMNFEGTQVQRLVCLPPPQFLGHWQFREVLCEIFCSSTSYGVYYVCLIPINTFGWTAAFLFIRNIRSDYSTASASLGQYYTKCLLSYPIDLPGLSCFQPFRASCNAWHVSICTASLWRLREAGRRKCQETCCGLAADDLQMVTCPQTTLWEVLA